MVLSASSSRNLRLALRAFCSCAEAEYAALVEESGTVLLETGTLPAHQSAIIGALANGAFIAVRELASRLGDDCCEGLYHQGRTKHFSIVPLSPVTTLITVFGNDTKLGIVRSATARYGPTLRDLLDDSTLAHTAALPQDGDLDLSAPQTSLPSLQPARWEDAPNPQATAPVFFSPFLPLPPLHQPAS